MTSKIEQVDEILVKDPGDEEEYNIKKRQKKLIIISLIVALIFVGAIVYFILFYLKSKPKDGPKEDSEGYIVEDLPDDTILKEKIDVNDEPLNELTKNIDPEKETQQEKMRILLEDKDIIKPKSTKISSEIIQLKNGLIIGLIQNPNINTSAVAVSTPYGNNIDLVYGFAHFNEHIVFGGSIKNPDNSLFMTKVNKVKGVSNAFTTLDKTVYMFNSPTKEFDDLFTMFKYMIYRPSPNDSYISDEINAVNSEMLMMNFSGAYFTLMLNEITNPEHPLHNGGVGTNITLNSMKNIKELAINSSLYLRYSLNPDRLKMVIYSNKKLEEMKDLVKQFNYRKRLVYNSFVNKINQKKYDMMNNDLFINNTGKFYLSNLSNNSNTILLCFQVPQNKKNVIFKTFINYLMRFKERNSLFKKTEQYLINLGVEWARTGGKQDLFLPTFILNHHSSNKVDLIIEEFYKFIEYLKGDDISNDYLNDFKKIMEQSFKYELDSEVNSYSKASDYVQNLMNEDYQNFLKGSDYSIQKDEFTSFLNNLTVENMVTLVHSNQNQTIISNDNLFDKKPIEKLSRYFNFSYLELTMKEGFINNLKNLRKETYTLPNIKNFQTKKPDEDIKPCENNCSSDEFNGTGSYVPSRIISDIYTANYKIDKTFKVPIVSSKLSINFAYLGKDDKNVLSIFTNYLNYNKMLGYLSNYTIHGFPISYSSTANGIDIGVVSYSDLVEEIYDKISKDFIRIPSEQEYQFFLDYVTNEVYYTESKGKQINHATEIAINFFSTGLYKKSLDIRKNENFQYTYNNFTQILKSLLERVSPLTFSIVGDINKTQIEQILKSLNDTLKPNIYLKASFRMVPKKASVSYLIKSMYPYEKENIAIKMYQFPLLSQDVLIKLNLFNQCFNRKVFFNILRTKKQLGYAPSSTILIAENIASFIISINSARYTPYSMDSDIEDAMRIALESPCEDFDKIVAYLSFKEPSVINLNVRLSQISTVQLQNSVNQIQIKYEDVQKFMKEQIMNNPRIINVFLYSALVNDNLLKEEVELFKNKKSKLTSDLKTFSTIQDDFMKYCAYSPIPNEKELIPPSPDLIDILYENPQIKRPLFNKREYEIISLKKNKYTFILINDPNTVESAIAIKSKVGSLNSIFDGLGEFAVNAFYCGSEQNRNKLKQLISNFNGTSYTFSNHQSSDFVFSIYQSQYEKMVKLISDYIFNYKIDENYINNEIKVSSSNYYSSNYTKYIFYDILGSNCNKDHPFGKTESLYFGNKEIFEKNKNDLNKYLEDYYKLLFKPENSYILLYGKQSILELRTLAQRYFDKELKVPSSEFLTNFNNINQLLDNLIFSETNLGQIATINTNREMGVIEFYFEMNNKNPKILKLLEFYFNGYKQSDNNFSLKSFLATKNYSVDMKIYKVNEYLKSDIISIRVDLTQKGTENIDKVIEAVFAGINIAKEKIGSIIDNFIAIESQKFKLTESVHLDMKTDLINYINNFIKLGPTNLMGDLIENNDLNDQTVDYLNNMKPEKVFILIDSIITNSDYIKEPIGKSTNSYKINYKINKISKDDINKLSTIKEIEGTKIDPRSINNNYCSLNSTSIKPCYEQSPYKCLYEEHDPSKSQKYDLYILKEDNKIYSLFKTDRSFNLPFIKGFIQIAFNENMIRTLVNNEHTYALLHLYFDSFTFMFKQLNWEETGNKIEIPEKIRPAIQITFSTYNNLFSFMNDKIYNFFGNSIDENSFNILKQRYALKKSNNKENSYKEYYEEMIKIFTQFITVNTTKFDLFSVNDVLSCEYEQFTTFFKNLNKSKEKLIYLSFGDVSYNESYNESNKIFKLINYNVSDSYNLLNSVLKEKYVVLPELSSFIYYTKTKEDNNNNNRILVLYEITANFINIYKMYIFCIQYNIYNYMRNIKGSVYDIELKIETIGKNYYFVIYAISPIDNPETLEKYINEAINQTLINTYKCENLALISDYLTKGQRKNYTSDDRLIELINKSKGTQTESNSNINQNITYETIVSRVTNDIINLCKRIVIFNYRNNITQNEIDEAIKLIPKKYTLNSEVTNNITNNITELGNLESY